jgi:hypothetical protein
MSKLPEHVASHMQTMALRCAGQCNKTAYPQIAQINADFG